MQFKNPINLSLLLSVLFVGQLFAEELKLPNIVVSASRSDETSVPHASSIKVITREEIQLSGAKSLPDLLRGQPGVFVSDIFGDGSNATIDMRGFGPTANANTLIMVDGRKLNFSSDLGTLYFNSIDLDNVEQVEIVQGSSGILFGNMAVGGVINVITRKPEDSVAEVSLGVGSYNTHKETVRFEDVFDDSWSARGVINNRRSDNYRDNNKSEMKSLSLLLEKQFNEGDLFIEYEYLDDYVQTPGALFLNELASDRKQSVSVYSSDYQDLQNQLFRLGGDYQINDNWSLEVESSWQNADREFITSSRYGAGTISTQNRESIDLNPRMIGVFDKYQVTIGMDLQDADYLLVSALGAQGVEQEISSLYTQSVISITNQWDVVIGLRHARIENDLNNSGVFYQLDDDITVGAIAIGYKLDKNWKLHAKIDQNYRFAKVEEHTNVDLLQTIGLKNQTGITYEFGGKYESNLMQANLQLYQINLKDEIGFSKDATYDFSVNTNIDKTERKGISIGSEFFVNNDLIMGLNIDYVRNEITEGIFSGNELPLVPQKRLSLFAEYSLSEDNVIRFDTSYTGEQTYGGDFDNTFAKMQGYTVVNVSSFYEQKKWSLTWRINNLFDRKYSEVGSTGDDGTGIVRASEFTAPERNFWLGLKVNLSDL